MTNLVILLILAVSQALDLGGNSYPDSAFLKANFTDGSSAILKSYDSTLYLCANEWCTSKQSVMIAGEEVITSEDTLGLTALSLCDKECVPCSSEDSDWECKCWGDQVMNRNVQCVRECPNDQKVGANGMCEKRVEYNWVELVYPIQKFPHKDFTIRIEAERLADELLITDNFVIGSSYIEFLGKRFEFDTASCLDDVCVYTVSYDHAEHRLLFWQDFELRGSAEVSRDIFLHQVEKIPGVGVNEVWYTWDVRGPMRHTPRRLQTNCHPNCGSLGCNIDDNPTACLSCNEQLLRYDTASTRDDEQYVGQYYLCLISCATSVVMDLSTAAQAFGRGECVRDKEGTREWLWSKFTAEDYLRGGPINEEKTDIGVNLIGGDSELAELSDPIPAYQRGLYFTGYSSWMTFENLNLGTDFTIGAWVKAYDFRAFYEIYKPGGVIPTFPEDASFLRVGRYDPPPEKPNERSAVGWAIRTWNNDQFLTEAYANTMASTASSTISLYDMEEHWWLLMLRVNAKYVPSEDSFALNMRMYYNENFGGDDFTLLNDYFEDNIICTHRLGYNAMDNEFFRGYVADQIYFNVGLTKYDQMYRASSGCVVAPTAPSTPVWQACCSQKLKEGGSCVSRGSCSSQYAFDDTFFCPDCCAPRNYDELEECFGCGSLCMSCINESVCDYCIENASIIPGDDSGCQCDEGFRLDPASQNCCEDKCLACAIYFTCDQCMFGYEPVVTGSQGQNTCTQTICFEGTLTETECVCGPGYFFDGTDCVKNDCHEGCDLCTTDQDFRDCLACEVDYHDIAPTVTSGFQYAYCVPECPTGYSTGPCAFSSSTALVLKWYFNIPSVEYTNSGSGGFSWSVHQSGLSVAPAKNRGVYFDGVNDGYITISGLVLSHSCTMITWCNNMGSLSDGQQRTMFYKAGSANIFLAGGQLAFQIQTQADRIDASGNLIANMTPTQWYVVAYEATLDGGYQTDVSFFINDNAEQIRTIANFNIDLSANDAYFGAEWDGAAYGNRWYGYFFDFQITNAADQEALIFFTLTQDGCATLMSGCWAAEYNQYVDHTNGQVFACDASCTAGCINGRDCRADCLDGHPYCHLCLDYECQNCSTYDNCTAASCAADVSTDAGNGQTCLCNEPDYGRGGNIDIPCALCDDTCATCNSSALDGCLTCDNVVRVLEDPNNVPTRCICNDGYFPDPTHETCTQCHDCCVTCFGQEAWQCNDEQCADGFYQWNTNEGVDGASLLCLQECPSGYEALETPYKRCVRSVKYNWFFSWWPTQQIEISQGSTYTITVTRTAGGDGPVPVHGRGVYFNGSNDGLEIENINIGTEFSIQVWYRSDANLDSLFGVFNGGNNQFYIGGSGGNGTLGVGWVSTYDHSVSMESQTVTTETGNGNFNLNGDWNSLAFTYWAARNEADSGNDRPFGSEMRFFINEFNVENHWIYGQYMEDNFANRHTLGLSADGSAYNGFIGSFTLWNFRLNGFQYISWVNGDGSCPSCTSMCPTNATYMDCAFNNMWDTDAIQANCNAADRICATNCPVGNFYEPISGLCQECRNASQSCRIPQNDRVCTDILCETCTVYDVCEFGCTQYAHEESGVCVCDTDFELSTEINACSPDCHEICTSCNLNETNRWQCSVCANGYVEYPMKIGVNGKEGILCLLECPTGWSQLGLACVRTDYDAWVFDYFRRADNWIIVRGVELYGGSTTGVDSADPNAVYGRGQYFDGNGQYLQFQNFNMGYDWTYTLWFWAYDFNTIYSIQNDSGHNTFECNNMVMDGQNIIGVTIQYAVSGDTTQFGSQDMANLAATGQWSLTGQWNNIQTNYAAYYLQWDGVDQYQFGQEINMYLNDFGTIGTDVVFGDYWEEDNFNFNHYIAWNGQQGGGGGSGGGSSNFNGWIADAVFGNYSWTMTWTYTTGPGFQTNGQPDTCPTYQYGAESQEYIDCKTQCINDNDRDTVGVDACVASNCSPDPFCAYNCPLGEYADVDDGYACKTCASGCSNCRNGITCSGCEDPLCLACTGYYDVCDNNSCKVFASFNSASGFCECDDGYTFDETTHNCCFTNCQICSDPEGACDLCEDPYMGDRCDSLGCTNGDLDENFVCNCWDGYYGGEDGFCDKIPCLPGCELCSDVGENSWHECFQCADGFFNISMNPDYVVCVAFCPTGYVLPACTPPDDSADNCIFYFDFNRPDDTFANLSSNANASAVAILESTPPSGLPLKNRGIYFSPADDEPACIVIEDVVLAYSFHVSYWARLDSVNTGPLWGKDGIINIGTTEDSRFSGSMNGQYEKTTSNIDMYQVGKWTWFVVEVQLNAGFTRLNYWTDGTLQSNVQCNGEYLADIAPAPLTIGCFKDSTETTTAWRRDGFILDFRMCLGSFDATININYWREGCGEQYNCSEGNGNEWIDGNGFIQVCHSTCPNGCVNGYPCRTDCPANMPFCYLCTDPECDSCRTYATCDDNSCGDTATNTGTACQCDNDRGFYRDETTGRCGFQCVNGSIIADACVCNTGYYGGEDGICDKIPCVEGCALCTDIENDNWAECVQCAEGYFDTSNNGFTICSLYCPTGFSGAPNCLAPGGNGCIFIYEFNRPAITFENLSDNSFAGGFGAQLESNAPNGYPAKNKGIHFTTDVDQDQPGCIYVQDVTLNHTYSFHMWVRQTKALDMPIFEKTGLILVGITIQGGFFVQLQTSEVTAENGFFTLEEWAYVVVTVCLQSSATQLDFFVGQQAASILTFDNQFLFDNTEGDMLIGCDRSDDGVTRGWFDGYILDFSLCNKKYQIGVDVDHYIYGCGQTIACGTCAFNQYYDSVLDTCSECDASCAGRGCTHGGPCKDDCEENFPFCHLCTDSECKKCDTYTTCSAGFCGDNASNAGDVCTCNEGTVRDPITQRCLPCDERCASCDFFNVCSSCGGDYPLSYDPALLEDDQAMCLETCPTGYTQQGNDCVKLSIEIYVFPLFWTSKLPVTSYSIKLDGAMVSGGNGEPEPAYGRGFYFDNTNSTEQSRKYLKMTGMQRPFSYAMVIWYKADSFSSIVDGYCNYEEGEKNFSIYKVIDDNGVAVWGWTASDFKQEGETQGYIDISSLTSFNLEGEWNMLGFDWSFQGIEKDMDINSCNYVTEITSYHNENNVGFGQVSSRHPFGDKPGQPLEFGLGNYQGFIGDIYILNCAWANFSYFGKISADCPGCKFCPADPKAVECSIECVYSGVVDVDACVSVCLDGFDAQPMCTDHCGLGEYCSRGSDIVGDEPECESCNNGYVQPDCPSQNFCRTNGTCYTCDDSLCMDCDYYKECDECVANTVVGSHEYGCECLPDFNYDAVHHACCAQGCVACYSNGQCIECQPGYIPLPSCDRPCNGNGSLDANGECVCDCGYSGLYCETACDRKCKCCAADDFFFCTECHGNKIGDRCDQCDGNWDPFYNCNQCLPGYFHDSVDDQNCQHECTNGTISDDFLQCRCHDWHFDPSDDDIRGNCTRIECYGGCLTCLTTDDYRDCSSCDIMNGWADPDEETKGPDEPRVCTEGCPTGYKTLSTTPLRCRIDEEDEGGRVIIINFNRPTNIPENEGTVPDDEADIDVLIDNDFGGGGGGGGGGTSGQPQKDRGVCFDGSSNTVMEVSGVMLRPTYTVDIWFQIHEMAEGTTCTVMDKDTVMDLQINYGANAANTVDTVMGVGKTVRNLVPQTTYLSTKQWHNVVYSYQEQDARNTEANYYIDGLLVKTETHEDCLVIDSTRNTAYLGAFYDLDSNSLIQKCDCCYYDLVITQTQYTPGGPNDRNDDEDPPEFCDADPGFYCDEEGEVQECHPNCPAGCVDGQDCGLTPCVGGSTFCYLCHDRECSQCTTYENCDICRPTRAEDDPDSLDCRCKEGLFRDSIEDLCEPCDDSCNTCDGFTAEDCTSCKRNNELSGASPNTCVCIAGLYPEGGIDNCRPCTSPCAACTSDRTDSCTSCYEGAHLTAGGECECDDGTFMNAEDPSICDGCHATCATCSGVDANQCISCHNGAFITISGTCECYNGPTYNYIPQPDATNCIIICGHNCHTCDGAPWNCTACTDGSTPVNGNCGCPSGTEYIPTTSSMGDPCVPTTKCHYDCKSCFGNGDPNNCTSCFENAVLRQTDHPSYCDCAPGFNPQLTTNNCIPNYYNACSATCASCERDQPDYCLTCKEGAMLDSAADGVCICKDGFVAEPDASRCQKTCAEGCLSCFLNDSDNCTACDEGYVLAAYNPVAPSRCITIEEACPEHCGICHEHAPFTCVQCDDGYRLIQETNTCVEILFCHPTCYDCDQEHRADSCTSCWPNAMVFDPQPPNETGYCECVHGTFPTPDATNCQIQCSPECETCSGPTAGECTSCPEGMKLQGVAPACCKHVCHHSCEECSGPEKTDCTSCRDNATVYYSSHDAGRCVCQSGYQLSIDYNECVIPHSRAKAHEFIFDSCQSDYESNGVCLVGSSYDSTTPHPLSVHHRGVFFNNKSYFQVNNLIFGSNFAMNTWIKSHDTGYATLFSTNTECQWSDSEIINFSWRLANSKNNDKKRKSMLELKDWTSDDSHFLMKIHDPSYKPKAWANIGFTVKYDWEECVSTITFYGYDCDFYIRSQLSTPQRFARSDHALDIIGHRVSEKDEPVNQFLGFMYYLAIYNYAADDFSGSIGYCRNCGTACAANGMCLSDCWYSEYNRGGDDDGQCCACASHCRTCFNDGHTCFCNMD